MYDFNVNSRVHSDGVNETEEMNLYKPNPLLDSPFEASDLEWLYRQQDVDGYTLSSRLAQLAPISFTNALDGQRRRRLFALDSWETNNLVWTNDNPGGAFSTNSRFAVGVSAGFQSANLATPSLAHRNKKINLNYPLPVSNDPNEPIRQKWINDAYQLLKSILPPRAIDTPEELAQLSQYVINIIDFRDTDSTMTHWVSPDVMLSGVLASGAPAPTTATPVPILQIIPAAGIPAGAVQLDQYGMEYNPVAINEETIAYSFSYTGGAAASISNRFLIELVNTQTMPELPSLPSRRCGRDAGNQRRRDRSREGSRQPRPRRLTRIRSALGTSCLRAMIRTAGPTRIAVNCRPSATSTG